MCNPISEVNNLFIFLINGSSPLSVSEYVYEELLKFSKEKAPIKAKRPPLLRQESIHLSPKKRLPHDPRTGKGKERAV